MDIQILDGLEAGVKFMYGPHYDDFTIDALLKMFGPEESLAILAYCGIEKTSELHMNLLACVQDDKKKLVNNLLSLKMCLLRKYPTRKDVEELTVKLGMHMEKFNKPKNEMVKDVGKEMPLSAKEIKEQVGGMQMMLDEHLEAVTKLDDKSKLDIMKLYNDQIFKGVDYQISRSPMMLKTFCPQAKLLGAKNLLLCSAIRETCGEASYQKIREACHLQVEKKYAAKKNEEEPYDDTLTFTRVL